MSSKINHFYSLYLEKEDLLYSYSYRTLKYYISPIVPMIPSLVIDIVKMSISVVLILVCTKFL